MSVILEDNNSYYDKKKKDLYNNDSGADILSAGLLALKLDDKSSNVKEYALNLKEPFNIENKSKKFEKLHDIDNERVEKKNIKNRLVEKSTKADLITEYKDEAPKSDQYCMSLESSKTSIQNEKIQDIIQSTEELTLKIVLKKNTQNHLENEIQKVEKLDNNLKEIKKKSSCEKKKPVKLIEKVENEKKLSENDGSIISIKSYKVEKLKTEITESNKESDTESEKVVYVSRGPILNQHNVNNRFAPILNLQKNSIQKFGYEHDSFYPETPTFNLPLSPYGNAFEMPLSPPKSVSPVLKDFFLENQSDSNYELQVFETANFDNILGGKQDTEDLINIIESLNCAPRETNEAIGEKELRELRSVVYGEDFLRDETNRRNEWSVQPTATFCLPQNSENNFFPDQLTPPRSVSPVQPQEYLSGIEEILPDELNIYLKEDKELTDYYSVRAVMQNNCDRNLLQISMKRIENVPNKSLCKLDADGDSCLMIVYSKPESSASFYENIFCLQEKLLNVLLCCDVIVRRGKGCKKCGCDRGRFYTPLSLRNNHGDTALTCALKRNHSSFVIDYLLGGIMQNAQDFRRTFDDIGRQILLEFAEDYPKIKRLLCN